MNIIQKKIHVIEEAVTSSFDSMMIRKKLWKLQEINWIIKSVIIGEENGTDQLIIVRKHSIILAYLVCNEGHS